MIQNFLEALLLEVGHARYEDFFQPVVVVLLELLLDLVLRGGVDGVAAARARSSDVVSRARPALRALVTDARSFLSAAPTRGVYAS